MNLYCADLDKLVMAYCTVSLTTRQTYRTALSSQSIEPRWEQAFAFQVTSYEQVLGIRIHHYAKFSADGKLHLSALICFEQTDGFHRVFGHC